MNGLSNVERDVITLRKDTDRHTAVLKHQQDLNQLQHTQIDSLAKLSQGQADALKEMHNALSDAGKMIDELKVANDNQKELNDIATAQLGRLHEICERQAKQIDSLITIATSKVAFE